MITLKNPSLDPFYNQALEEVVFNMELDEDVFWLWRNSPAVIVGCYQNICREVKAEALRKQNIPVIRRITGGGTVYHDLGNVNYTLIMKQDSFADYDRCLAPVIHALNDMGIPARRNRTCDIAIGNGKISGSAQKNANGRLLHHGTLLFDTDLNKLDTITTHHKNDHFQVKGTLSDICTVTNIRQYLKEDMTIEQFMQRLTQRMVPEQQPELVLTQEQQQQILLLRDEKYKSWEWTWGKTPPFTYEKHGEFAGKPIHISYQARRGILSDVEIDCDCIDKELAAQLLNRSRLDPERLSEVCRKLAGERQSELLELLI